MWKALEHSTTASVLAQELAQRFHDAKILEKAISEHQQYTVSKNWHAMGLGSGFSGLAIMSSQLEACYPGQGWSQLGDSFLAQALHEMHRLPSLSSGLHNGISGIAFAMLQLGESSNRYQRLLDAFDEQLIPIICEQVNSIVTDAAGISTHTIDIISGITGIGAYLLRRQHTNPKALIPLQKILAILIHLITEKNGIPRWHTPAKLIVDAEAKKRFPNGCVNLGMAHGVAGMLALLALATLDNVDTPTIDTALSFGAEWLINHRITAQWGGPAWPTTISAQLHNTAKFNPVPTSWCWGSPGIARALWLVGNTLHCQHYQDAAIAAMLGIYTMQDEQRFVRSPAFCHGIAGVLHITLRFAHDTQQNCFKDAADKLLQELLQLAEPETLLGYRNVHGDKLRLNQPWLSDGVAGILLVLLAAGQAKEPTWDRAFLIA